MPGSTNKMNLPYPLGNETADVAGDIQRLAEAVDANAAPSAHKTSHATGGADALAPGDIGAATQADLDALEAAHTAHLAKTLQQGVHGIATTADITLYVDATNGNDSNPGTQTQPLKTIQAAINKIPQIVNHGVIINVAAGTYNENVNISGFIGKGTINILGGADLTESVNYVITGNLAINKCSCFVYVKGFKLIGTFLSDAANGFVYIFDCIHAFLQYLTIDGSPVSFAYERGLMVQYSKVRISSSNISNMAGSSQGYGIYAEQLSEIFSDSNQGSGNTVALVATGGIIRKTDTQPTGTTNELISAGGQIV